jgi:predicted transcriptional regulator
MIAKIRSDFYFMAVKTVRVVVYVSSERKQKLDQLCELRDTNLSALFNEALSDLLTRLDTTVRQ